jgi:hypothetical protein
MLNRPQPLPSLSLQIYYHHHDRVRWVMNVAYMGEVRNAYEILESLFSIAT